MQTLKNVLKKDPGGISLETQISRFLFWYRITPHSTTGVASAELLIGRRPRSRLDVLHPDIVRKRQSDQKEGHDQHCRQRELSAGEAVWVKNHTTGRAWLPGTIVRELSRQKFQISLEDGRVVDRHIDHVRHRVTQPEANHPKLSMGPVFSDPDLFEDSNDSRPEPPADVVNPSAPLLLSSLTLVPVKLLARL